MDSLTFSYEIGIIAGICFVVGLALLNFGVVTANSPLYQSLNLLGALGFTYTAISPFNPGLFITEVVWAIVALYGLWKIFIRNKRRKDAVAAASAETPTPPTPPNSAA